MRIFISYRRTDLGGHAEMFVGRIVDRLIAQFGDSNVFLDINTIPPGCEFDVLIAKQVAQADVLLAVIGPDWLVELQSRSDSGQHDDFVHIEIKAALERRKHLIPVLIGGASMPESEQLPATLNRLCKMNGFVVDSGRDFHDHLTDLIDELESLTIPTIIDSGSFRAIREDYNKSNTLRYLIQKDSVLLTFGEVIEYWVGSQEFRSFYNSLFTTSGLYSYVWEAPPITINHLTRPFEFVLISSPTRTGSPDHTTYSDYFNMKKGDEGVVAFDNLGKDALLVVPSPYRPEADYSDFEAFFKNAPVSQHHALWRMVGKSIKQRLGVDPQWLSVAGGALLGCTSVSTLIQNTIDMTPIE